MVSPSNTHIFLNETGTPSTSGAGVKPEVCAVSWAVMAKKADGGATRKPNLTGRVALTDKRL